jgi:hypothetical protein
LISSLVGSWDMDYPFVLVDKGEQKF